MLILIKLISKVSHRHSLKELLLCYFSFRIILLKMFVFLSHFLFFNMTFFAQNVNDLAKIQGYYSSERSDPARK